MPRLPRRPGSYGVADRIKIWARRTGDSDRPEKVDWCDEVCDTATAAVEEADFVVVCTPVDRIVPLIREISDAFRPAAIVTDVGSVKGDICRLATEALEGCAHFVGSHPMAGSEKSGMEHASADLFQGPPLFCHPPGHDPGRNPSTRSSPSGTGSDPRWSPCTRTSTMKSSPGSATCPTWSPPPCAACLAGYDPTSHRYAGGGLRDTTRVAGGSPDLWLEILLENRDEVLRALAAYQDELQPSPRRAGQPGHAPDLTLLQRGKNYRDQFPS